MKVYVEVYGCTANKSDASLIKGILKENNHEIVQELIYADVIIILTCTVIDTTEQRMLSRLKVIKKNTCYSKQFFKFFCYCLNLFIVIKSYTVQ